MKKTLLMAAVLVLAACGEKKAEAPPAEVPAMADSSAMMSHDSGSMMHSDSMMTRDSAK